MKLYLVQHGAALDKDIDPDRPLSEQGNRDIQRLAERLQNWGVRLSWVIHSGKTRAQQTAEPLAKAVGLLGPPIVETNLNPKDPPEPVADKVNQQMDDLMLVGHMPFLGKLAALLVSGDENHDLFAFQPASLLCLERDGEGKWWVTGMIRPDWIASELGRALSA